MQLIRNEKDKKMSPLVTETAPRSIPPIMTPVSLTDMTLPVHGRNDKGANDNVPARKRSILERRRQRWTRRAAH